MLGKLMKYDLRYCLRRFVPMWIAAAALSMICGLFFRMMRNAPHAGGFTVKMLSFLLPLAVFGVFVAMGVMTLVFICERFYRGLLGSEGYLMNTLPAAAETHIASKGINALILETVTGLITLLSGMLLLMVFSPTELSEGLRRFFAVIRRIEFPAATPWLIAEGLVLCLAAAAAGTLQIYAAISLGHLARRHRILWAVLIYIGINIALSILFNAFLSSGLFDRILFGSGSFFSDSGEITARGLGMMARGMGLVLLWELLLGAGFFLLSRFILKKRLNLE